jgi:hypothetical protein
VKGAKRPAMIVKAPGLIPTNGCGKEFIAECSALGRVELRAGVSVLAGKGIWTI